MDKQVYKDIKLLIEMVKKQSSCNKSESQKILNWAKNPSKFSDISPCYLYSNENLRSYYEKFSIMGENVLTVTGSGDQVLSAILYGASHVDTFDTNRLTYYNLMLKKYAIMALSYDDFKNFYFLHYNYNRLDEYNKISKYIKEDEVRFFWDEFFFANQKYFSNCFLNKEGIHPLIVKRIPYMDLTNYEILKNKIDNCEILYKNLDILKIDNFFKNKYSFINLSNILQYVLNKKKFVNLIKNLDKNNLEDNGNILLNYHWLPLLDLKDDELNTSVYKKLNVSSFVIDDVAINNEVQQGSIIVHRKKSK